MRVFLVINLLVASLLWACRSQTDKATKKEEKALSFFQKPLADVELPFEHYVINASSGGVIFCSSGSIIRFPAHAFVDAQGNVVEGDVDVVYREFRDPLDMYFAGIPMEYDSAGITYTFVSSGMNEINAYQKEMPLFVNPDHLTEVHYRTDFVEDGHNLYFLDTVQQRWIFRETNQVTQIQPKKEKITIPVYKESYIETETLLKPQKADGKNPLIELDVDPSSVEELKVYHNLQFQIAEDETNFQPSDASIEWEDVVLKKGRKKGYYFVEFSLGKRKVVYHVKAVFVGKDYDQALLVYEEKMQQNEKLKKQRIEKEANAKKKYIEDSIANEKIKQENLETQKLNQLIEERNKQIARKNEEILQENERKKATYIAYLEEQKKWQEEQRRKDSFTQVEQQKIVIETQKNQQKEIDFVQVLANNDAAFRSFEITQFGIWNCDHPALRQSIIVKAKFEDMYKNPLYVNNITVINTLQNTIFQFENPDRIAFSPSGNNMIIATVNNKIAFLSFERFKKSGILNHTNSEEPITIKLAITNEKNVEALKATFWQ